MREVYHVDGSPNRVARCHYVEMVVDHDRPHVEGKLPKFHYVAAVIVVLAMLYSLIGMIRPFSFAPKSCSLPYDPWDKAIHALYAAPDMVPDLVQEALRISEEERR